MLRKLSISGSSLHTDNQSSLDRSGTVISTYHSFLQPLSILLNSCNMDHDHNDPTCLGPAIKNKHRPFLFKRSSNRVGIFYQMAHFYQPFVIVPQNSCCISKQIHSDYEVEEQLFEFYVGKIGVFNSN